MSRLVKWLLSYCIQVLKSDAFNGMNAKCKLIHPTKSQALIVLFFFFFLYIALNLHSNIFVK